MTLQLRLSPEYVLDKMEFYEIRALMKYKHYSHKDEWEQARFISYVVAQVNSKKKLKLSDIIDLPWEKENEELNKAVSDEEVNRLRNKAAQLAETIKIN